MTNTVTEMILHYPATEMQEIPPCRKSGQLFNWPDVAGEFWLHRSSHVICITLSVRQ